MAVYYEGAAICIGKARLKELDGIFGVRAEDAVCVNHFVARRVFKRRAAERIEPPLHG